MLSLLINDFWVHERFLIYFSVVFKLIFEHNLIWNQNVEIRTSFKNPEYEKKLLGTKFRDFWKYRQMHFFWGFMVT
jgi:hypothetical protein